MAKIEMEVIFEVTQKLPGFHGTILRALQIINDPEYSIAKLSQTIGLDQTLTARVLQWANSPFYGLRHKVSTLDQAIITVGTSTIRELLLVVGMSEMLNREMPGYGLDRNGLWRHSMAVAAGARWLAKTVHYRQADQAFIAGLLHDIGKLVLDQLLKYDGSWHAEWVERQEQGETFIDLERWLTGLDHAELGGRIAENWNLPPILVEAIAYHHDPTRSTVEPILTHLVHLADATALMLGVDTGYDGLSYELCEESLAVAGFRSLDLEALMQVELDAIEEAESMFRK